MNHRTARRLAALAAGNDLSPGELEALQAHLAGCPPCAVEARALRESRNLVQRLSLELNSLGASSPVSNQGKPTARPHRPLLRVAALVGVALLGAWWGSSWISPVVGPGTSEATAGSPVLVRLMLTPGDDNVERVVLGRVPPPQQVCSARVQPLHQYEPEPASPPRRGVPVQPALAADPQPVAPGEGARARALVVPGGLRLQPTVRLTHGRDGSTWMVCEVP